MRGLTYRYLSKFKHVTLHWQRKYLEFINRNQYFRMRDLVIKVVTCCSGCPCIRSIIGIIIACLIMYHCIFMFMGMWTIKMDGNNICISFLPVLSILYCQIFNNQPWRDTQRPTPDFPFNSNLCSVGLYCHCAISHIKLHFILIISIHN